MYCNSYLVSINLVIYINTINFHMHQFIHQIKSFILYLFIYIILFITIVIFLFTFTKYCLELKGLSRIYDNSVKAKCRYQQIYYKWQGTGILKKYSKEK